MAIYNLKTESLSNISKFQTLTLCSAITIEQLTCVNNDKWNFLRKLLTVH
jgi:hypothetical protein